MKIIGIRELKDRLSEYLRHVRQKGPVYVSNRGQVVAELRMSYGPGKQAAERLPEGLRQLVDEGKLRVGTANDPSLYPVLDPLAADGLAATLLDEERG